MTIQFATLSFLTDLAKNNNRDWFQANKDTYTKAKDDFQAFIDQVAEQMATFDELERKKMFRIYRDTRFSKDKTPYKTHLGASFVRSGASRRGGYGLHVAPNGQSAVAGGFFSPEKEDLYRIRKEIELNGQALKDIIEAPVFKKTFGSLQGETLKSAPRGFAKDHPHVDLLRHKQFYFVHHFTDKQVLAKDFAKRVADTFRLFLPYFDFMSETLTTDLNGQSLL